MVTGGAGFLAGHLIERLMLDGHEVRTVELPDRLTPELAKRGTEVMGGDLRDPEKRLNTHRTGQPAPRPRLNPR